MTQISDDVGGVDPAMSEGQRFCRSDEDLAVLLNAPTRFDADHAPTQRQVESPTVCAANSERRCANYRLGNHSVPRATQRREAVVLVGRPRTADRRGEVLKSLDMHPGHADGELERGIGAAFDLTIGEPLLDLVQSEARARAELLVARVAQRDVAALRCPGSYAGGAASLSVD